MPVEKAHLVVAPTILNFIRAPCVVCLQIKKLVVVVFTQGSLLVQSYHIKEYGIAYCSWRPRQALQPT